jgi:nucleoid-associated protein YgaU
MKAPATTRTCADAALAAVILLLGIFLVATGRCLLEQWKLSSARGQSPAFEDIMGLVANTSGLIVVVWWLLSLLIAFASAALARTGNERAADITGKFSPAFMRRLALAAVGLQLLGAPLAQAAADPSDPAWSPTSSSAVSVATALAENDVMAADSAVKDLAFAPLSAAGNQNIPLANEGTDPRWKPEAPVVDPGPLAAQPVRSTRQHPAMEAGHVTVRAGDSLWSITARELGGPAASDLDVALEWPRWYEANRAVIGDNPGLLLPGQILRPPVKP